MNIIAELCNIRDVCKIVSAVVILKQRCTGYLLRINSIEGFTVISVFIMMALDYWIIII